MYKQSVISMPTAAFLHGLWCAWWERIWQSWRHLKWSKSDSGVVFLWLRSLSRLCVFLGNVLFYQTLFFLLPILVQNIVVLPGCAVAEVKETWLTSIFSGTIIQSNNTPLIRGRGNVHVGQLMTVPSCHNTSCLTPLRTSGIKMAST